MTFEQFNTSTIIFHNVSDIHQMVGDWLGNWLGNCDYTLYNICPDHDSLFDAAIEVTHSKRPYNEKARTQTQIYFFSVL